MRPRHRFERRETSCVHRFRGARAAHRGPSQDSIITRDVLRPSTSTSLRIRSKRAVQDNHMGLWVYDGLVADMTLILVSNRLPVTVRRVGNRLEVQPNPGGVAAGLASGHQELRGRWFGWPGSIAPGESRQVAARPEKEFDCHPVFLPPNLARLYYCGVLDRDFWPV